MFWTVPSDDPTPLLTQLLVSFWSREQEVTCLFPIRPSFPSQIFRISAAYSGNIHDWCRREGIRGQVPRTLTRTQMPCLSYQSPLFLNTSPSRPRYLRQFVFPSQTTEDTLEKFYIVVCIWMNNFKVDKRKILENITWSTVGINEPTELKRSVCFYWFPRKNGLQAVRRKTTLLKTLKCNFCLLDDAATYVSFHAF